jgi:hypothetical protein
MPTCNKGEEVDAEYGEDLDLGLLVHVGMHGDRSVPKLPGWVRSRILTCNECEEIDAEHGEDLDLGLLVHVGMHGDSVVQQQRGPAHLDKQQILQIVFFTYVHHLPSASISCTYTDPDNDWLCVIHPLRG